MNTSGTFDMSDDPDIDLSETASKKAPRKGRSVLLTILIAAVPALLFYALIRVQNLFVLSFSETIGVSLLAAAAVLAVMILIDRFREHSPQ